jgi:phage baseplate assembly protein W
MITLLPDITAQDWSLKLGAIGEVVVDLDDIGQCIRIILSTPKGSDPHRPLFGSDLYKYIDYPVTQAIPHIVRESVAAITLWELRVEVVSVVPVIDGSHVTLQVEWKLRGRSEIEKTEVPVYGSAA